MNCAGRFEACASPVMGSVDVLLANTAFFGQMAPNTGVTQNGVVGVHPGFNAPGAGGILDAAMFANADFKLPGYQIAQVSFRIVPEPSSFGLAALAGIFVLIRRRRVPVVG